MSYFFTAYGISCMTFCWLTNYLRGRTQQIKVKLVLKNKTRLVKVIMQILYKLQNNLYFLSKCYLVNDLFLNVVLLNCILQYNLLICLICRVENIII